MKKWQFLLLIIFLSSCIKDLQDTINKVSKTSTLNWSPEIAIPLLYTDLGVDDIVEIKDDLIEHRVENDKSITLIYESTLFSLRAEDAFILPNQSHNENYSLSAAEASALAANGSIDLQIVRDIDFSYGLNQLDSILLKGGDWNFTISTSLQHNVGVSADILNSSLNGYVISNGGQANYSGTIPVIAANSLDLNGAALDLTAGSQGHSQFRIQFDIHIETQAGNPVLAGDYVDIDLAFVDLEFSSLKGYLPNTNLSNGNDSLFISIFKNSEDGSFTMADPRLKLKFTNSFGAPIRAYLDLFEGTSESNNTLALSGYPSQFDILAAPSKGEAFFDSVLLNSTNTNIVSYVDNSPYTNVYQYSIYTNPLNQSERIWMLDSSVLQCDVQAEVPLYGTAKDYKFESTSVLSFDAEIDEYVKEIMLRMHSVNSFPADLSIQMYFEDSTTNTIIDSLMTDDLLLVPSSNVDASGKTVSTNPKTIDVIFNQERLEALKQVNQARFVVYFNTLFDGANQPDVKFFNEYNILVQFGIQSKLHIDEKL